MSILGAAERICFQDGKLASETKRLLKAESQVFGATSSGFELLWRLLACRQRLQT